MADNKKKSIYSRKLKDVNKDGKRNFGDTWLGDLIGADGKIGVQYDSLKDSMKGSRRETDAPTSSTRPKARPEKQVAGTGGGRRPKVGGSKSDKKEVETPKLKKYSGRGDGAAEVARRAKDRIEKEKPDNISVRGPAKSTKGPRKPAQATGKPTNPNKGASKSTMKPGFQGRYTTSVVPGNGMRSVDMMKRLSAGGRGGGYINKTKNRLNILE